MDLAEMICGVFSRKPRSIYWKSQDGRLTAIEDMDDRHLINAYCVLDRDPKDVRNAIKPALKSELVKRGLVYIHPTEGDCADEQGEEYFNC